MKKIIFVIVFFFSFQCFANEYSGFANKVGLQKIVSCKFYSTATLDVIDPSKRWALEIQIRALDILLENWNSMVVKAATEALRLKLNNENLSLEKVAERTIACADNPISSAPPKLLEDAATNNPGSRRVQF